MPPTMKKADAPESQVLFLNYREPSLNAEALCKITGAAIDSVLVMLGATPGFIRSLPLANKKAILYLASHAVDWRSCIKEYNDLAFCFSRALRAEKSSRIGIGRVLMGPFKYAEHIRVARLKPKIVELRKMSYELNHGITEMLPQDVIDVPPSPALDESLEDEGAASEPGTPISHITPLGSQPEENSPSVDTASPINEMVSEETSELPDHSKTASGPSTGDTAGEKETIEIKDEDDDDISIDVNMKDESEPTAPEADAETNDKDGTHGGDDTEYPASKKRKLA